MSISIETRPEVGEGFAPVASMFRQFELIYVVGDERDIVGVRTNHRHETCTCIASTPLRKLRGGCSWSMARINELADQPEFYHLLSNSCTINIVRYANAAGRSGRFDIRHLLNGLIDSYLYPSGRVDTTLPFDELRRRSLINEAAKAADGQPISRNVFGRPCQRSRAESPHRCNYCRSADAVELTGIFRLRVAAANERAFSDTIVQFSFRLDQYVMPMPITRAAARMTKSMDWFYPGDGWNGGLQAQPKNTAQAKQD